MSTCSWEVSPSLLNLVKDISSRFAGGKWCTSGFTR